MKELKKAGMVQLTDWCEAEDKLIPSHTYLLDRDKIKWESRRKIRHGVKLYAIFREPYEIQK